MTIAITPVRTGNPGVVPPWLQGGARPVAPTPAPDDQAPTLSAPIKSEILRLVPLSDGSIVIVDFPDEPRSRPRPGSRSSFGGLGSQGGVDAAEGQRRLETTVDKVRSFYAGIGVTDAEGNGPAYVRFDPNYNNGQYVTRDDRELDMPADSVIVGIDESSGRPFHEADDVIAHEWAHRIVDHTAKLSDGNLEDAAIHESLADTFAAAYDGNWTMGEKLGEPIRYMDQPERVGHPGHVADLRAVERNPDFLMEVETSRGSVRVLDPHVLAGIPNKAAAIIGTQLGLDPMSQIYLKAMRDHLGPNQEIEGLATATLKSANELFGAGSRELQVTRDAWDAVGVLDLLRDRAPSPAR